MKVVLLRVGIDSGAGGMQGPLLPDGTFAYVPIPDTRSIDNRTYGNTLGRKGRPLADYFPESRRKTMARCSIHFDPEFSTFTYGDPTRPKKSLRKLEQGDLLVFYAGLEGWSFSSKPALYLIGYFEVEKAGITSDLGGDNYVRKLFANFHVRHVSLYLRQKNRLVRVKGGSGSRLFQRAALISSVGRRDIDGRELKVLSQEMQRVFGDFNGRISIQRSPPRWIDEHYVRKSADYVRSLK